MKKTILVAAIALVLGLAIGFVVGRALLERRWSQPYSQVAPSTEQRANGGNPSPKVGTKVLAAMPIGKSRAALATMTDKDPVVSRVAAVGANDDGVELHVVVENRSGCTITSLEGVAYAFDPNGRPAPVLNGGESFVAFTSTKASLEPGQKTIVAEKLKGCDDATLAIAQIDHTTCADGTSWTRR